MGYESKLYIVERHDWKDDDGRTYASVLAMFDMCKMGSLINVFEKNTDLYFYGSDGNTKIVEDMYCDPIREATLEDVIDVLEEAVENGENYRRIFPLLAALKTFYGQKEDGIWDKLAVLHFGY
jgi:hypothetical protein